MNRVGWGALAVSLALNAWLLIDRARAENKSGEKNAQSEAQKSADAERAAMARAVKAAAERALAAKRPAPLFGGVAAPAPARPSFSEIGAAEEREALCEMAREQMKQRWLQSQGEITQQLIADLRNPLRQEENVRKQVDELSSLLDLHPPATDAFAGRLRAARASRLQTILGAVDGETPDWPAALTAARGLFSDEDRLARDFAGDNGLQLLRASDLDSRTGVLAILSVFAGAPMESSNNW